MRTIALRHVAFEDVGVWGSTLRERGHALTYLEAGDDLAQARDADLVIVLGGPIGVADGTDYPFLVDEIALIAERLDRDAPTLGVCLGAQLMAAALGAKVYPAREKEVGWGFLSLAPAASSTPLRVLADSPVLHWHSDTFDLPRGAVLLASTAAPPRQAFSHGRSLALQFHCEANGGDIERWLVGHTGELRAAGIDIGWLREQSRRHALAAARAGRAFLDSYLDTLVEPERKPG